MDHAKDFKPKLLALSFLGATFVLRPPLYCAALVAFRTTSSSHINHFFPKPVGLDLAMLEDLKPWRWALSSARFVVAVRWAHVPCAAR